CARFCRGIIDAVAPYAAAVKPQSAFFEALGADGFAALEEVCAYARSAGLLLLLDAKRGDIGSTAKAYARAAFEVLGADAITVSPYLGRDSVEPFLANREKGVFLLCRTSNEGGRDFQMIADRDGVPLYERVAQSARVWNVRGNVGLVAGATFPEELARIRALAGDDMLLLVPGVGAQGASPRDAVLYGANARGERVLVAASRSILYAGDASPAAQRGACEELREELNKHRPSW
ncbi:MAG: orotidine-5'-phosphate decarboxylase, partial [Thermoplasmatota archaeon]